MKVKVWPLTLVLVLVVASSCGSDGSAQPPATEEPSSTVATTHAPSSTAPVTTLPATTVPATTVPVTTVPVTTLPATTDLPTTGIGEPMTVEELAVKLPIVDGYEYTEIKQTSVWGLFDPDAEPSPGQLGPDVVHLEELATTISREVYVEGGQPDIHAGWLGEVSVFDAGAGTPQLWKDFVDYHFVSCLSAPSEGGVYVSNFVPGKWRAIGDEVVLTGAADPDGDIGAAWFHDGLIFAVSGWSSGIDYVERLIAQQAATGVEPERVDFQAVEGTLADVLVPVPGYQFLDPEPADVMWTIENLRSNCVQHVSFHWIYSSEAAAGIEVYMAGYAEPSPCDRGAWIIDKEIGEGGTRQDINGVPAVISGDGEQLMIVADTGIYVSAIAENAEDLLAFMPVLEMLADVAAATEI